MLSSKNQFCIALETEKSKVKQVENLGRALGSASMMVYPYVVEARKGIGTSQFLLFLSLGTC